MKDKKLGEKNKIFCCFQNGVKEILTLFHKSCNNIVLSVQQCCKSSKNERERLEKREQGGKREEERQKKD